MLFNAQFSEYIKQLNIVAIQCPTLPYWEGMLLNDTKTNVGVVVEATCGTDFYGEELQFPGNVSAVQSKCSINGTWIPAVLSCVGMYFHLREQISIYYF